MDFLFHIIGVFTSTGSLDLILVLLGFFVGIVRGSTIRTPILAAMLVLRMAEWYMKTHPHGKQMAAQTSFDEEIVKFQEKHFHKHTDNVLKHDSQVPGNG